MDGNGEFGEENMANTMKSGNAIGLVTSVEVLTELQNFKPTTFAFNHVSAPWCCDRKGDLLWILDRKDKFLYGTLAKGGGL